MAACALLDLVELAVRQGISHDRYYLRKDVASRRAPRHKSSSGHGEKDLPGDLPDGRVSCDPGAMRVKGLVWLGIPADDYAAAVRFFGET